MRLNQVIAVEKGQKNEAYKEFTRLHQLAQKEALTKGLVKKYRPNNEEDTDVLPGETTRVQVKVSDVIEEVSSVLGKLFDVTATKDIGNLAATADIIVDEKTLAARLPATYLIFLEKQLTDLRTFIRALPTLDLGDSWQLDVNDNLYKTKELETSRSKKVLKVLEKSPATDKHPAQTETYTDDVPVGKWITVKMSGALPQVQVNEMLSRLDKLVTAVKFARQTANEVEVVSQKEGALILDYIFKG